MLVLLVYCAMLCLQCVLRQVAALAPAWGLPDLGSDLPAGAAALLRGKLQVHCCRCIACAVQMQCSADILSAPHHHYITLHRTAI